MDTSRPTRQPLPKRLPKRHVLATAERLDALAGRPPTHADDDRPCQDRIGEIAEARYSDGAVCGDLLSLYHLTADHAPTGDGTAAMPCVQQATEFLVVPRLRPEDRVNLVEEDSGPPLRVRDLTKKIGRRHVDGLDGMRDQQLGNLQPRDFPLAGSGDRKARRGVASHASIA